ncbi:MAG TPA: sulfite exporter TauE/SafE family protein, partial [Usitatibacter sp.]
MTILAFAALGAASLVTSFISGILGMAGGMILMGVLLAFLPLPAAMMLHGICQFSANGWRAAMLRREIDWRIFRGYAIGAILALALFAVLRIVVSKPVALIAMGLTPFVALVLPERLHLNVERRGQAFVCGLLCSAISLTAGISGPILDIFFVRSKMTRHKVVATKASTQSLSHVLKIIYFGGVLAVEGGTVEPWLAVTMVALAVVGTSLSRQVLERITDASFRLW